MLIFRNALQQTAIGRCFDYSFYGNLWYSGLTKIRTRRRSRRQYK
ncbi:hypothetical protein [Neisseria meningitidis]|nr:hypothetical protein [Neisseria meningitidis]